MSATFEKNYQSSFFRSAIYQGTLCLLMIVCRIAMAISRADSLV